MNNFFRTRNITPLKYSGACLFHGLVYALLALGSFAVMPESAESVPLWLPTGYGLAIFLRKGLFYFPFILAGAAIAQTAFFFVGSHSLAAVQGARHAGAFVESAVAAFIILRRMEIPALYRSVSETSRYCLVAALSAVAGSLVTAGAAGIAGGGEFYWQRPVSFWASGFISMMLVSPMILAWKVDEPIVFDRKKNVELVVASSVLALVVALTFGAKGVPAIQFSLLYLMIPVVLWLLYSFNHRYGMVAVALVVLNIMAATDNGIGAISAIGPVNRVLVMQLYIAVLALILILVGAYIGERHLFKNELYELNDKMDNIILEKTEKLERTEERFHNIFNTSLLGVELFDKNGDLVDANETALKIFGVKNIVDLLSYNLLRDEFIDPVLLEKLSDGKDVTIEFWYNFDSEYRPQPFASTRRGRIYLQVMINSIRDSRGSHFAYVALIQDITERKTAEDKISRSEERLADIQRLANLGSWEYHIRRREFSLSREAAEIIFISDHEEAVMKDYYASIHEDDRSSFEKKMERAIEEGTPFEIELRHVSEKGEIKFTITRVHPLWRNDRIREIIGTIIDITSQKEIEQALRKSENTFKTIFSQSPLGILLFDNAGSLIDLNPATLGIFGIMEVDPLENLNLFNNIIIEVKDKGRLDLGNSLRFTTEVDFEEIRRQGYYDSSRHGIAYVEVEITAIKSLGYLAQVRDMSREFIAERAIRENEERLRTIFDNAGMGIVILDTDLQCVDCNSQWLVMMGYNKNEMLDGNYYRFTHSDDLNRTRRKLESVLSNSINSYSMEKRYVRKDGTIMWGSLSVTAIKDSLGNTESIIGIIVDITRRKEIELRLKESEEFLRRVIDTSPNPIFVKNWNGEYTLANKAVAELLGSSVEEMLGKKYEDFLPERDEADTFFRDDREVMVRGKIKVVPEEKLTSPDGSVKWLKTIKVPLREHGYEAVNHILGVSTDITELKIAQQKLIEMATHDPLTGLPNRRHFYEKLGEVLARSKRQGKAIAVLFVDLDGFKEVNDRLGHDAGDILLKQVAEELLLSIREVDIVSRLGGDEFTIILESVVNDEDIIQVAGRIVESIDKPIDINGREARVTASIGISVFPRDGEEIETLIKKADDAMYLSKKKGKNRYTFCE